MKIGFVAVSGFLEWPYSCHLEGEIGAVQGAVETDAAKRGLAREWALSGAIVTAPRLLDIVPAPMG